MASVALRTRNLSPPPVASVSVLGKRKWSETPTLSTGQTYVLRLTTPPPRNLPPDNTQKPYNATSDHLEAVIDRAGREAGPSTVKKSSRNRSASASSTRRKSYICSWEGCDKAYTKPCRLAEHYRFHTNDRPFECSTCQKSFLRKVHLQAHERSHASKEERPLVCSAKKSCEQRFWTQQQLRVHEDMHRGEKPYKCEQEGCQEGFTKHSQLRAHIAAAHSPPGTKHFQCDAEGCDKSFATSQKLRAHLKTHQEDRYACFDVSCSVHDSSGKPTPLYFRTWTALQTHNREIHPPTCFFPNCHGKTFKDAHSLKTHLRAHGNQVEEDEPAGSMMDLSINSEVPRPKRPRMSYDDGRSFQCQEDGCDQSFKTAQALKSHHKVKHLGQLPFECTNTGCSKRFGYKRNLQHHLRRCKPPAVSDESSNSVVAKATGRAYVDQEKRVLRCPWTGLDDDEICLHVFSRMYDLRRHLVAAHGVDVSKNIP